MGLVMEIIKKSLKHQFKIPRPATGEIAIKNTFARELFLYLHKSIFDATIKYF